jgi:hypothetical protein
MTINRKPDETTIADPTHSSAPADDANPTASEHTLEGVNAADLVVQNAIAAYFERRRSKTDAN